MTSNAKTAKDPEADFSFGLRELSQINGGQELTVAPAGLSVAAEPLELVNAKRGFDPYNSGSFDRDRNWGRVSKR